MSIHFSDDISSLQKNSQPASIVLDRRGGIYRNYGKQFIETTLVLVTAIVTVPVVLFLALLVGMDGSNPFYRQKRVGRDGRIFSMWKLRTMVPDAEERLMEYLDANPRAKAEWEVSQKLKDDPRVTRLGRFLRRSSLDELPQLWNVVRGEMSLVGPRPMMVNQRSIYAGTSYYALRPGITGLWQTSDRNECTFTERAAYDAEYDRSISLLQDVAILFRTIRTVTSCTGY
ncbi:sugar transferase [Roseitranquillus sediminis]|uniref:sugar transferase n=1 Tax=Roseitranquillus sediminis TaxID=2809051 RepID=UPI001D0C1F93|nr:sugar transferase [Roseitranquillus sediminis]MBM9596185.1 sugar transferase [Roseitranquillus sediminis]